MVEKALVECADFHFAADTWRTRQALQRGSCEICAYLTDNLVRQISEYLGQIDKTVKAVYLYEPFQSPQTSQLQVPEIRF